MAGDFLFDNGEWTKDGHVVPSVLIHPAGTIPWEVAEEAYKEYVNQNGQATTLDRICRAGGFGAGELAILLFERVKHLERRIYQLRGQHRG